MTVRYDFSGKVAFVTGAARGMGLAAAEAFAQSGAAVAMFDRDDEVLTVKFARELADEGIRVNAVDPGLTHTDLGGAFAEQSASDGARIAVELAKIDAFGPTAGFFVSRTVDKLPRQHEW